MKAFPKTPFVEIGTAQDGMDLRDYFAAKAMQGYITGDYDLFPHELAEKAYVMADAMMKAREQE
jgi:hypothetical protein